MLDTCFLDLSKLNFHLFLPLRYKEICDLADNETGLHIQVA